MFSNLIRKSLKIIQLGFFLIMLKAEQQHTSLTPLSNIHLKKKSFYYCFF